MVCASEGMTSTHTINQMKLLTSIAAAASVIGTSFIAINPVEASTHCTTNRHGARACVEMLGARQANILVNDKFNDTGYIMWLNCSSGDWRVRANTGYSRSDLNHEATKACSFI